MPKARPSRAKPRAPLCIANKAFSDYTIDEILDLPWYSKELYGDLEPKGWISASKGLPTPLYTLRKAMGHTFRDILFWDPIKERLTVPSQSVTNKTMFFYSVRRYLQLRDQYGADRDFAYQWRKLRAGWDEYCTPLPSDITSKLFTATVRLNQTNVITNADRSFVAMYRSVEKAKLI